MLSLTESSLEAYIIMVLLALDLQAGRICCFCIVDKCKVRYGLCVCTDR